LEKGGSWLDAIIIALKSMSKSLSERRNGRKNWIGVKEKRIGLQTTLRSRTVPIERQLRETEGAMCSGFIGMKST
jgi:hypothetical protein